MLRFANLIFLSLLAHAAVGTLLPPPPNSNPPHPILPGQYRMFLPSDANNRHKPEVYIAPPNKIANTGVHPGLVVDAPSGGPVKVQIITKNLRGAPGEPIQSIDKKTQLKGSLSYKQPMEFDRERVGGKWQIKGVPVRDMSPTTLDKVRKQVLPVAAVNAFQQGSSKGGPSQGAHTQPGRAQRPIMPLPKAKMSSSSWRPVSVPAGAPAPKQPPSGAFTFSMPKPEAMKGSLPPRVNLDPKGKAPAAGSKRKSQSHRPASPKRRIRSPGASSKRRSPSPGGGAKRPRLSRRDYLGRYYSSA